MTSPIATHFSHFIHRQTRHKFNVLLHYIVNWAERFGLALAYGVVFCAAVWSDRSVKCCKACSCDGEREHWRTTSSPTQSICVVDSIDPVAFHYGARLNLIPGPARPDLMSAGLRAIATSSWRHWRPLIDWRVSHRRRAAARSVYNTSVNGDSRPVIDLIDLQ